jgi:hypothetical protein
MNILSKKIFSYFKQTMLYFRIFSKNKSNFNSYEFASDRVSFQVYFMFGCVLSFYFLILKYIFFHIKRRINSYIDKKFLVTTYISQLRKQFLHFQGGFLWYFKTNFYMCKSLLLIFIKTETSK